MCIYSFIRGGIAVLAFTMRIFNKWAGEGGGRDETLRLNIRYECARYVELCCSLFFRECIYFLSFFFFFLENI